MQLNFAGLTRGFPRDQSSIAIELKIKFQLMPSAGLPVTHARSQVHSPFGKLFNLILLLILLSCLSFVSVRATESACVVANGCFKLCVCVRERKTFVVSVHSSVCYVSKRLIIMTVISLHTQ